MNNSSPETPRHYQSFAVITGLFFMWGFMTVLNDILIPYLKGVFELNYAQAMLVQFSFFGAYFVGSLLYFIISVRFGDPILRIGYKNGIILGLLISAAGSALFYPAASFKIYGIFLSALFIMGIGFTLLQIAANPYVSILGHERTASSRLNLSQGFNSLGTTIGPLIGGYLIFTYFADHEGSGEAVRIPYVFFSALFIFLAILIWFAKLPRLTSPDTIERSAGALRYRHLVFGIFAIFFYVGGEVSIGSLLISFFKLENIAGLSEAEGSTYVSFYWGGLMIGRFLGAVSLSNIKSSLTKQGLMLMIPLVAFLVIWYFNGLQIAAIYSIFLVLNYFAFLLGRSLAHRTLFVFALFAIGLLITALFSEGKTAMWSIIGIGLFNSIMWSNIFTLAIEGLGKYKSQGSSLLVMAILGGALIPLLQGAFADAYGLHASFLIPVFCHLYMAFYGLFGYKRINPPEIVKV
jgi:FHS family L-fucose permease-like MFS transporter